jgi:hypothetical protein
VDVEEEEEHVVLEIDEEDEDREVSMPRFRNYFDELFSYCQRVVLIVAISCGNSSGFKCFLLLNL